MRAKNTIIKQIKFDKELKERVWKEHELRFAKSKNPIEHDFARQKIKCFGHTVDWLFMGPSAPHCDTRRLGKLKSVALQILPAYSESPEHANIYPVLLGPESNLHAHCYVCT